MTPSQTSARLQSCELRDAPLNQDPLFSTLRTADIAGLIRSAERSVCYAGPGVQREVAEAMVDTSRRLGPEMVTVCIDFDERVLRMGYGDLNAVTLLREASVALHTVASLRTALVIVDDIGFIFTPTALYLEAESAATMAPNAVRMSGEQRAEALARLSPAAKAIAVAQATTAGEKQRIAALPLDVSSKRVTDTDISAVRNNLENAPPVRFDLARQVRVFEPYLQYVELRLTGAAIQRKRLPIPRKIQKLGGSAKIDQRLRTTFELIERDNKLSSKPLEDELDWIRDLTHSFGKHNRLILKQAKPHLVKRLPVLRTKWDNHKKTVAAELQQHLDDSFREIVDYYLPRVIENPPAELLAQITSAKPSNDQARRWLERELLRVFPKAESPIEGMALEAESKDVTLETLNRKEFYEFVKKVFPDQDWDKPFEEFRAAGQTDGQG